MVAKVKKDTISVSEAQNNFDNLLELAQKNPVKIERNGRPVAVVISYRQFERMEAMVDTYLAHQAEEASKEGFLDQKQSEDFLAEMLNIKD
jgi:prevent-host-death family protein